MHMCVYKVATRTCCDVVRGAWCVVCGAQRRSQASEATVTKRDQGRDTHGIAQPWKCPDRGWKQMKIAGTRGIPDPVTTTGTAHYARLNDSKDQSRAAITFLWHDFIFRSDTSSTRHRERGYSRSGKCEMSSENRSVTPRMRRIFARWHGCGYASQSRYACIRS